MWYPNQQQAESESEMTKYNQPKSVKMPPTYDGMATKRDPKPYLTLHQSEKQTPKSGTVRGKGAATKGAYMSKNG